MSLSSFAHQKGRKPIVAWFTYFPVEWLEQIPSEARNIPIQHPATWQRVLLAEFERTLPMDLHILVLRKSFPSNFSFVRRGVTFHCLKTVGGMRAPSLYWLDTVLVAGILSKIKPDLCHAWGTEYGAPIIASRLKYPTLVTMQGLLGWLKTRFPLPTQMKISAMLEPKSLRKNRFATAESSFGMKYLQDHYSHLNLFQIEHAPDPVFFQTARDPQKSSLRFVCLSSFNMAKGADVLIKTLNSLAPDLNFEITFIGGKDELLFNQLKSATSPDLWARVKFLHNLSSPEVAKELASATMMLYPSRADSSPNSVKESVVMGVPVVASAVGGIVDHVHPGKNGFLFETENVDSCAEQIRNAVAHPLFGKGLVEESTLAQMRSYLSPQTMATKFLAAYEAVLQKW
ncbi:MAG: glycosyltransferase family 4 protein [Verrucomicrobiales bacterium]